MTFPYFQLCPHDCYLNGATAKKKKKRKSDFFSFFFLFMSDGDGDGWRVLVGLNIFATGLGWWWLRGKANGKRILNVRLRQWRRRRRRPRLEQNIDHVCIRYVPWAAFVVDLPACPMPIQRWTFLPVNGLRPTCSFACVVWRWIYLSCTFISNFEGMVKRKISTMVFYVCNLYVGLCCHLPDFRMRVGNRDSFVY